MKQKVIAGLMAVAFAAAAACSDDLRAPVAPRGAEVAGQPAPALAKQSASKTRVNGVRWRKQLKSDVHASALIGPDGGVLTLPATGLRLVVPPGAVGRPTRFGVSALEGKLVAYDFEPAGAVFPVALRVEQDPAFVDLKHGDRTRAVAGYFPSRTDLDQTSGTGRVAELLPISWATESITFSVRHFSGYIMSWGLYDEQGGDGAP